MFFAVGASQTFGLVDELGIRRHYIIPGAVLIRDTPKNICQVVEEKIVGEKHLIIFLGGHDLTDKKTKTMRPQYIKRHYLRKDQQLLRLRKRFQPHGKLVWILLAPRNIIENPHMQPQIKELNNMIKTMIVDIKAELIGPQKNFVAWVETESLCHPVFFRPDGVHLNSLGLRKLAALTRAEMTSNH